MKEQILPELPIVGRLKLKSRDGKTLSEITVARGPSAKELDPLFERCYEELHRFLSGKSKEICLPLDFSGLSAFQVRVLSEMKKIPYGKVISYRDLARAVNTKGYQAVGSACGRNPFMLIYPCHRVVASSGPGGFAHGLRMKQELLRLEGR